MAAPVSPLVILVDGDRAVAPYAHEYRAFCKARWIGRALLDVLAGEFDSHSRAYFAAAITAGAITLNGAVASPARALRDGDALLHVLHRHEPRVPGTPLRAVFEDAGVLVVAKPGGIAVHPAGAHHYLTLTQLLAAERGVPPASLFVVHRLDRATSGVVIFARTRARAQTLSAALRGDVGASAVRKRYFARVQGAFPAAPGGAAAAGADAEPPDEAFFDAAGVRVLALRALVNVPIDGSDDEGGAAAAPACPWLAAFAPIDVRAFAAGADEGDGGDGDEGGGGGGGARPGGKRARGADAEARAPAAAAPPPPRAAPRVRWARGGYLRVSAPLATHDAKNAVHGLGAAGAARGASTTLVRLISRRALDATSLVEVIPLSGRSHQIRVHLAAIGFPIVDDPLYCAAAAAALGARAAADDAAREAAASAAAAAAAPPPPPPPPPGARLAPGAAPPAGAARDAALLALCQECASGGRARTFSPAQLWVRAIALHSAEYVAVAAQQGGEEWRFAAPLPPWAAEE